MKELLLRDRSSQLFWITSALKTMSTPPLLQWPLSLHDKDSLSVCLSVCSSLPLWAGAWLLPYVALVSTACLLTAAKHWVLMLFLLKENAGATGLCEFWHRGVVCLEVFHSVSGSVADAQADLMMSPVDSQRFLWHVFFFFCSVMYGQIRGDKACGSHSCLVELLHLGLGWLIGLASIWHDSTLWSLTHVLSCVYSLSCLPSA